jgi:hypothetical protein
LRVGPHCIILTALDFVKERARSVDYKGRFVVNNNLLKTAWVLDEVALNEVDWLDELCELVGFVLCLHCGYDLESF